ncbi:FHA domain-containing protein [Trichocoleus desertorum]|uniref:FHA domain-containing protein n=2 Tax=Trichocoleus TaxID=450526 RepID=A0ABV0J7P8_9CYAN|nr:FHA domain-containing protein [Trichocoleus sp. FACHB-46]
MEAQSYHLLIVEDNQGQREVILDSPIYSIGTNVKCDIHLHTQFAARCRATLVQLPHKHGTVYYRIVDGNLKGKPSANGLLINGRSLQAHDLQNQDEIVFGAGVSARYYTGILQPPHEDKPPNSEAHSPRKPNPLTPSTGAEAIPDSGWSQIP